MKPHELRPAVDALRQMVHMAPPEVFRRYALAIAWLEGWNCIHNPDEAARRVRKALKRTVDLDWALLAFDFFIAEIRREEARAAA